MTSRVLRGRSGLLLACIVPVLAVMVLDFWAYSRRPWDKWPVDFSGLALVRSVVIALAAVFLVSAVRPDRFRQDRQSQSSFFPHFGILSALSVGILGGAACLLVFDPGVLARLGKEDGVFEYVSAVALLMAALVTILAGYYARGRVVILGKPVWACLPYFLIGGAFTLIFLEEVSWGQRLLGFGTPEFMQRNLQGEFNLHNLSTNLTEQAYYSSMLLAFVLLPYASHGLESDWPSWSASLVPIPVFALVAAPAAFLQAEMWNTVLMQLAAWGTLLVLLDFARVSQNGVRYWSILLAVLCVVAQIVFLTHSDSLRWHWDLTEYRETLFALLCLVYAVFAFQNVRGGVNRSV
jgi:hypothetical protein